MAISCLPWDLPFGCEVGENQTLRILVEEKDAQLKIVLSRIEETETELEKGSLEKQELLKLLQKQN